jgi:PadR family transcriptional regulator, regulatory protein AphA
MDIQYAILGYLSWQPFSGYDLKKLIAESELFYWSGNNNQIYNSLVDLHKQGLVSQEVQLQESLPAKKVYSITAQGRAELRRQMLAAPELPEFHNHFLIQLAWAADLSPEELDALLASYEGEISVQFRMKQVQAGVKPASDRTPKNRPAVPDRTAREQYLWQKISENLLAQFQHELEWVRQVRAELSASSSWTGCSWRALDEIQK